MEYILLQPDLLNLFNKNSDKIKKKILELLNCPISEADRVGWIYGFFDPNDERCDYDFWIKMGRTVRNPFVRVEKEWEGELLFCFKSSFNNRLERLIHLFFDCYREPRLSHTERIKTQQQHKTQIKYNENENTNGIEHVYTNKPNSSFINWFKKVFSCFFDDDKRIVSIVEINNTNIDNNKKINSEQNVNAIPNKSVNLEIEWFHITDELNIISLTSQIWKITENIYKGNLLNHNIYYENDNIIDDNKEEETKSDIININKATLKQLASLPHIGRKIANDIIQARKIKLFDSIDEIKNINPRLNNNFDSFKNMICV